MIKCCRPIDSSICEVFGICYQNPNIKLQCYSIILQNLDMEIEIWNSLDYGLMMYKELLQYVVVYMVYVCVLSSWICCIPTLCIINKSFDTKIIWWWRRSFRFKNMSSEKKMKWQGCFVKLNPCHLKHFCKKSKKFNVIVIWSITFESNLPCL